MAQHWSPIFWSNLQQRRNRKTVITQAKRSLRGSFFIFEIIRMPTLKTKILNYRTDYSHYLADEIFDLEQQGYTQGNIVIMNPPVQNTARTILQEDAILTPPTKQENRQTSI
jgi:hypothetical protein